VLVDAVCSSATFQFALAIKQNGMAALVGESTGGNRRGINGGAYFFIRLPATGLEVDLPIIGYFPPEPQPDAGVLPDVPVMPSVTDIARGRDPAMAAALARIGAGA
jgi:C-terminal processing protease CtpA/Prc